MKTKFKSFKVEPVNNGYLVTFTLQKTLYNGKKQQTKLKYVCIDFSELVETLISEGFGEHESEEVKCSLVSKFSEHKDIDDYCIICYGSIICGKCLCETKGTYSVGTHGIEGYYDTPDEAETEDVPF